MANALPAPKPEFDIGRVFNRTFGCIRNNFRSFFVASLLIVGIPQFLIGLWPFLVGLSSGDLSQTIAQLLPVIIIISALSGILIFALQFVLQGAIVHASIADFNGRHATLKDSLRVGLNYIWPLIGFGLLAVIGMMIGFLFLIVPGIILAIMWSVGVPAMIVEGTGVSDSFSRSSELTSGYKWWIFLLFVIFVVISSIVSAVGAVVMANFGGGIEEVIIKGTPVSGTYWFMNATVTALVQVFSTMISAAGAAALYFELRQIKEGIGPQTIADVFD